MKPCVTWRSYYSVGDLSLDNQHKKILALINEIYEAMERRDDGAAAKTVLRELSRYALTHFRYEEQMMRDRGYPHVAEHSALHEEFRQQARLWQADTNLVTGRDLLQFLKSWWVGHIQSEDKKYMPCWTAAVAAR